MTKKGAKKEDRFNGMVSSSVLEQNPPMISQNVESVLTVNHCLVGCLCTQKDAFGEGAVELIFIAMLCNSNALIMKKILHIHIHA